MCRLNDSCSFLDCLFVWFFFHFCLFLMLLIDVFFIFYIVYRVCCCLDPEFVIKLIDWLFNQMFTCLFIPRGCKQVELDCSVLIQLWFFYPFVETSGLFSSQQPCHHFGYKSGFKTDLRSAASSLHQYPIYVFCRCDRSIDLNHFSSSHANTRCRHFTGGTACTEKNVRPDPNSGRKVPTLQLFRRFNRQYRYRLSRVLRSWRH